jgi:hypothetical protein
MHHYLEAVDEIIPDQSTGKLGDGFDEKKDRRLMLKVDFSKGMRVIDRYRLKDFNSRDNQGMETGTLFAGISQTQTTEEQDERSGSDKNVFRRDLKLIQHTIEYHKGHQHLKDMVDSFEAHKPIERGRDEGTREQKADVDDRATGRDDAIGKGYMRG